MFKHITLKKKAAFFLLSLLLPFCLTLVITLTVLWQRTDAFFQSHLMEAEKRVQLSLCLSRKNTQACARLFSDNLQIRQGAYLNDVGTIKSVLPDNIVSESDVNHIAVFDRAGRLLYQVATCAPVMNSSRSKILADVLHGTDVTMVHKNGDSFLLETFCRVFHANRENMVVGAVCVGDRINNKFARSIKNMCGVDIAFFDAGRPVTSSFTERQDLESVPFGIRTPTDMTQPGKITLFKDDYTFDAVPVDFSQNGFNRLQIYAALDHSPLKTALGKTIVTILIAFVLLVSLGAVIAMVIASGVVQSMNKIIGFARNLSVRQFDQPLEINSKDEFAEVAAAFNLMSRRLKKSFEQIENQANEIEKAKTYLNNIINAMPLMLIGVSRTGNIMFLNQEAKTFFCEYLGDEKAFCATSYQELLKHCDAKSLDEIDRAVTQVVPLRLESVACRKGKETLFHRVAVFPVTASGDSFAMICLEDTTGQHLMETRLHQAQKMEAMGRLAGGIAHDFNNILSGIFGYTKLAQMDAQGQNNILGSLDNIFTAGQRAADLIRQILTFTRQTRPRKSHIKIRIVVKEALKLLKSALPADIEIREKIESHSTILADATQMHQIVMNLCTNAYAAMAEVRGTLTVTLTDIIFPDIGVQAGLSCQIPDGAYVRLEVIDTGHGMNEDTLEKAFEPYFTTREHGKGTGLGLTLVHSIVAEHQGFLDVASTPGKGTRFQLFFPMSTRPLPATVAVPEQAASLHGTEKVLLVEDEEDVRKSTAELLQHYGYRIEACEDGEQAVKIFCVDPADYDLVITDMNMPKMRGDALAKEILAIRPDMDIILLTGYSRSFSREKAYAIGIRAYLEKPVTAEFLMKTIRQIRLNANAGVK
ncbi:hybrid sensor histidine kinase/response regulator [Desulfobacter vibrioformis]|uniref:hybrid sensor histidine kinase/response regulator n=1 Tax=Desulfobacter vibrioformis TaxID=34031 RepID=UPI00068E281F|nr:hybrid sensor histidine kinase/response regulator [Desulfobacter vibrioformis]